MSSKQFSRGGLSQRGKVGLVLQPRKAPASWILAEPVLRKKGRSFGRVMSTLIQEQVELARKGLSPHVICRVRSGWAVLGDSQFITGYSLLLPDPVVASINALAPDQRVQFLVDMTAVGDALLATTDAYRINYEILGNSEPALHAHIFPRRMTEPDQYRCGPVFAYPKAERESRPFDSGREDRLLRSLRDFLKTKGYAIPADSSRDRLRVPAADALGHRTHDD